MQTIRINWRTGGRTVLAIIIGVTCLRVWLGPITITKPASAQIPDSGKQRFQILKEAKQTNQLLREIKQLLQSHTFKVHVTGTDKPGADN